MSRHRHKRGKKSRERSFERAMPPPPRADCRDEPRDDATELAYETQRSDAYCPTSRGDGRCNCADQRHTP